MDTKLIKKKLPSGAELAFNPAPFSDAKALYQAILDELRAVAFIGLDLDDLEKEVPTDLIKNLFCAGFASKKIEAALWECFKRARYNGQKITEDTFEPINAREDYSVVCVEVARENIAPFAKSLMSGYGPLLSELTKDRKSRQAKATS